MLALREMWKKSFGENNLSRSSVTLKIKNVVDHVNVTFTQRFIENWKNTKVIMLVSAIGNDPDN